MLERIILYCLLIAFVILGFYTFVKPSSGRQAFIINQKVFDEFKGKILLEQKLKLLAKEHAKKLDSLATKSDDESINRYRELENTFALEQQQLSEKYTADLWKEINRQVEQYGKENNYALIFGATGNGSLMYGGKTYDLTAEIIQYINENYEEGN